jgi:hypothetical protein
MTSLSIIGAAIAIFVVAALLYHQSTEGFKDYNVPADLNQAPISAPKEQVPTATQRPQGIPGATTAPKEAMATRKELAELDSKLTTWLAAASQREMDNPAALTPEQLQKRVIYQARISSIRQQLGTGLITDTSRQVSKETLSIRKENAGWQKVYPNIESIYDFAKDVPEDRFLTPNQYLEFRGIMMAGLQGYQAFTQPDPLQNIRMQQLEVIDQDLRSFDKHQRIPPIRVGVARVFLQQMTKPDQPLPTLLSLEADREQPNLSGNPVDVIRNLKNIQWTFLAQYDPVAAARAGLENSIANMLGRLESGHATHDEVVAARHDVIEFDHEVDAMHNSYRPNAYNPKNLMKRADTLCRQIKEAFPHDAEALGCYERYPHNDFEAETIINTVCARLRDSVPTVTPEQFNCPRNAI